IFHEAYERRHRVQVLDAISNFIPEENAEPKNPRFQAVFCIDDREESFRRHLEEIAPDVETFGMAGFFNVAMYYRGAADAHFVPLCPIVVRPQHFVTEYVPFAFRDQHSRRARTRRALGTASHQLVLGSRSFAGGAVLAAGLGVLATIPLVARVLSPRLYSLFWRHAERWVQPPQVTHLKIERSDPQPSQEPTGQGFTLEEMANISERFLRDIGLTKRFSRLVLVIGHGSDSVNNPHKSVYDCGACGGAGGGPNARALSMLMNDLRVRDVLWKRGINLPRDTIFVGGLHDTCNDSVAFFDLDSFPASHHADFEGALKTLDETCDRNAHERCRRFWSAPLNLTRRAARKHVEGRAEDLAQTRPEYGHSTNSMCIVARRSRTRGLFLDRRSFFVSYDPTQDDDDYSILLRLMTPAVPVCTGINLQYTFSRMDSYGWGSGTKLPHNVSGLLGVMDGAASDLRPGLPWQGVEIHEPMRLLFIVETTPKGMQRIFERSEAIAMMFRNRWGQLTLLDPESSLIYEYVHGKFVEYKPESRELPTAATSIDWYRGWRENLGFATIRNV
ncbi:MAG TPA: putative inorganic carbon transporter subunit DabA, partial [Planctomycetaceae bacterium]|nr:putative inorganic carbon transporter subunit DabA [Planctomycetaceae bacterium]